MDTRVGFPNEHLANGSRSDLESPMYATAVGLVMKGVELNERNLKVQVQPDNNPIDQPIGDVIDQSIDENQTHKETDAYPKESYIDKWATALLKLLAHEK
jgi:cell division protein FtsA